MKSSNSKTDKNKRKKINLTSEDLLKGFEVIENDTENEYQRHKRRLGVAPGERVTVRWK